MPETGSGINNITGVPYDKNIVKENASAIAPKGVPFTALQPDGWSWTKIDGTRWDKCYPYQLMVLERDAAGGYTQKNGWVYTLPCPPESLSFGMPFAMKADVTLDGVVEEDNGAPVRYISISGTFGTNPARASVGSSINFADSIFAGSIGAAADLSLAIANLGSVSQQQNPAFVHSEIDYSDDGDLSRTTGFYQWRLFAMFMEAYAELKKKAEGRRCRLAFAIWKDESVYVVTPQSFNMERSVGPGPLSYNYSFSMKATGRVVISGVANTLKKPPLGFLKSLLLAVNGARRILIAAQRLPMALANDIKALGIEPLRQLTFFLKDALNFPLTFADTADAFVNDAKWAIVDALNTVNSGRRIQKAIVDRYVQTGSNAKEAWSMIAAAAGERQDTDDNTKAKTSASHPAKSLFDDPRNIFDLLDAVNVGDIPISVKLASRLQEARNQARKTLVSDLQDIANRLRLLSELFARAVGASNKTYDDTYGVTHPATRGQALTEPTDEDYDAMYAINDVIINLQSVIASKTDENNRLLNALDYIAGLAQRSGTAFTVPVSKFAVPFPYGSTLESLALTYLGDPNRWMEIAALNGLHEPYVDEEGFDQFLQVNGDGNVVMVADATQYFVGQAVWISSRAAVRTSRHITKIVHLSPTQHAITVDGASNLSQYSTLAGAVIHAFIPNTVNSQMILYIPSSTPPGASDFKTNAIPGANEYDPLIAVGGVDFLLDSSNNLVIGPDGSDRWAVGLTNIVQQVRLAFDTPLGALLDHPNFGNPIKVGMSVADLDPGTAAQYIESMFADNPSFSGVSAVQLRIQGPGAKIGVALNIAGTSQVIPVSVELKPSDFSKSPS